MTLASVVCFGCLELANLMCIAMFVFDVLRFCVLAIFRIALVVPL